MTDLVYPAEGNPAGTEDVRFPPDAVFDVTATGPPGADGAIVWQVGTVAALGTHLALNAGTLDATGFLASAPVASVAGHTGTVTLAHTDLTDWAAATSGFGTGSGSVTSITAGAGLAGGTITNAGTVSLGTVAAGSLFGNPGTTAAVPSAISVGANLALSSGGTLSATDTNGWTASAVSATGATGLTNNSGTLTARTAARMQVEWPAGAIVNNGTVHVCWDAPYAGTINSMKHVCNTGSFTAAIEINGSVVTGLSAITPTGTITTTNASAANTFTAGQPIDAVISSATTNAADATLSLNVTWAP